MVIQIDKNNRKIKFKKCGNNIKSIMFIILRHLCGIIVADVEINI